MTTKEKCVKSGLQAINDFVIIEEEPLYLEQDDRSGLTKDVVTALKESRLILPDIASGFADKFPFRGTIISKGSACKVKEIEVGMRVMFPRLGGMRWTQNDKQYINIRDTDLQAILD